MSKSTLVGHEKRWEALARAFAKNHVPQTLLISGPPQVGKWTLARRYAQLLLCPHALKTGTSESTFGALPEPCGACRVCHQVEIETFPDFRVYRPIVSAAKDEKDWIIAPRGLEGSIITVEMARKFGDEAMRKPLAGPRKVMLIEQAERMSHEAQNALLKTFEEPVAGLSIVFLCDNPSQLLPTVLSRCWHLPLGLVSDEKIVTWLRATHPDAGTEMMKEAVRVAAGRPGAAQRELRRLQQAPPESTSEGEDAAPQGPRFGQMLEFVTRIERAQPVGALALTEAALRLARAWWAEDQALSGEKSAGDLKKADAKVLRSAIAHFLDELAVAYRARWQQSLANGAAANGAQAVAWSGGLDQIRKTRHYILRNANANLALDVLFGQLIAAHQHGGSARRATANGALPNRETQTAHAHP